MNMGINKMQFKKILTVPESDKKEKTKMIGIFQHVGDKATLAAAICSLTESSDKNKTVGTKFCSNRLS